MVNWNDKSPDIAFKADDIVEFLATGLFRSTSAFVTVAVQTGKYLAQSAEGFASATVGDALGVGLAEGVTDGEGFGVGSDSVSDTTLIDGKDENTGLKPLPSIGPAKLREYVPEGAVAGIRIDPEPLPLASGEIMLLKFTPPGPERRAMTLGLVHPEVDTTLKETVTLSPADTEVGESTTLVMTGALAAAKAF